MTAAPDRITHVRELHRGMGLVHSQYPAQAFVIRKIIDIRRSMVMIVAKSKSGLEYIWIPWQDSALENVMFLDEVTVGGRSIWSRG